MRTPPSPPTLWTTLRDFTAVAFVCILSAIALFVFVERAQAGGTPLPPPEPGYQYAPPYPPPPYPPSAREAWAACAPDVRAYCPNVVPGGGRILSCLAGNKDRLSPRCRETLWRAWAAYRR